MPTLAWVCVPTLFNTIPLTVENSKLSDDEKRLNLLDDKLKTLTSHLQTRREVIQKMSEEYGALDMTSRYEFMLQRVADIQAQLTRVEATTLALETEIKILMDIQEPNMVIEGLTEAYKAASIELPDRRYKLIAVIVLAALVCGMLLAVLIGKSNHRLRTSISQQNDSDVGK